jgi:hypothetical protein
MTTRSFNAHPSPTHIIEKIILPFMSVHEENITINYLNMQSHFSVGVMQSNFSKQKERGKYFLN